eukprot:TRINITY_DN7387_c0_g1_i3.p1 TRINITY_DN7387_c0_g1~~TRINITY_DN7387_c0_g1_i3.p1  ORF type:complete len:194 (-),score=17.18 TRINITY_DN7387_c0_g1_i3:401-982(-)
MSKFQTRHNVKMLIFSHGSYVQNFDAVTLECFSCLKSMKNASIIYNMLEDKNAKGQGLPQEWPIREFELKLNYAGSNLALWKDKIPSMNTPFTRTRVCLPWATTQRNIDTACNNLLEICNEITSLSQLIIDVRSSDITSTGCLAIAQVLKTHQAITRFCLDASWTKLWDVGIAHISQALSALPLKHLHFSLNS